MAPLIIILVCFVLLILVNKLGLKDRLSWSIVGRLALAIMLVFTGIAHFTVTDKMVEMLPEFMPLKTETVYMTGILELVAAVGLLMQNYSRLASFLLIVFFLAILPANILGSIKQVELGGMEKGVDYLYFRIPLQLFFIGWTYFFGIHLNPRSTAFN